MYVEHNSYHKVDKGLAMHALEWIAMLKCLCTFLHMLTCPGMGSLTFCMVFLAVPASSGIQCLRCAVLTAVCTAADPRHFGQR